MTIMAERFAKQQESPELFGSCRSPVVVADLVSSQPVDHPVRLRLPPLHGRGIFGRVPLHRRGTPQGRSG
jgi:hypothetical protein